VGLTFSALLPVQPNRFVLDGKSVLEFWLVPAVCTRSGTDNLHLLHIHMCMGSSVDTLILQLRRHACHSMILDVAEPKEAKEFPIQQQLYASHLLLVKERYRNVVYRLLHS
jgi:hypothetical protein